MSHTQRLGRVFAVGELPPPGDDLPRVTPVRLAERQPDPAVPVRQLIEQGPQVVPRHPPGDVPEQLADDGVMIIPVGPQGGSQKLLRMKKQGGAVTTEELIGVRFVPLLPGKAREL